MHKFQLHPTICNNHKDVEITFDASNYTECPMCVFERDELIQEDYDDLKEENRNYEEEIDDLQREIDDLQDKVDELTNKLEEATADE